MIFEGREWICWDTHLNFQEVVSAPDTPPEDQLRLYAKDKAGVSSLYYKDDAGVEHDFSLVPASAAALTKTNDTNVTLTLGGSPTTALLAATSLTLGWTGQLSVARGGTAKSALSNVTPGSTKITLGGTPTAAVIEAFSIDVAEGNLTHNNLGGLTTGDPHTQYLLLAGRSGGQTANGDTASGGNLTLESTAHATKGTIILGATTSQDTKVSINGPYSTTTIGGIAYANMLMVHDDSADIELLLNLHREAANASIAAASLIALSREGDGAGGVVANGNWLGGIAFLGHDGTDFESAALIIGAVDGVPGNDDMPGRLEFHTTPNGSGTLVERLRISNFGGWGLAGANYGTAHQVIASGGSAAPPVWESLDSANFTGTNWTDLTDGGATTLHSHSGGGGSNAFSLITASMRG